MNLKRKKIKLTSYSARVGLCPAHNGIVSMSPSSKNFNATLQCFTKPNSSTMTLE